MVFLSIGNPRPVRAQEAADEIRDVVRQALVGLETRDTTALLAIFDSSATLVLVTGEARDSRLVSVPIRDIIAGLVRPGPERREHVRNERIHVSSDLATLVADYVFYVDHVLHHCGVAMYDLARVRNRWRIVQIRQTDRRLGCVP